MALNSINTNIAAYSAQGNISKASNMASASIARLSSGNRITKASDDVAALSIGTSLRTSVTTLKTALLNANQGSSLLQVADGALSQLSEILQRQKAIATQASSGSVGDAERGFLNQEFQALTNEINRISSSTNFNGVKLINGGLGTTTNLVTLNTQAAAFTNAGTASAAGTFAASTNAVQAFNYVTGASAQGNAAGQLQFVDSANALLTNGAYSGVNTAISGAIQSVQISNVTYGANAAGSADITITIGGVELTGRVQGAATNFVLTNGSTRVQFGTAALAFDTSSAADFTQQTLTESFRRVTVQRTQSIVGVDFDGTRLEGANGVAATGIAMARLNSNNAVISNFQYAGNLPNTANSSRLTVDINGQTFTATGVQDALSTSRLVFQSEDAQALVIDITGLDIAFTNIRQNPQEAAALVNALNVGFAKAGSGLDFQVGSTSSDSLKVSISSANATSLFNGQSIDVSSAATAGVAGAALDVAIAKVTALRADVGALQSRFNFASANLESSIQNQDAARGTLLDTDVSSESTSYATAQVQLQAGIAVLAQANQLPQNLLKLIG
ncbi:MAG: hypothetical protein DI582_05065 [Azospirillum brasilense]|nr:MAG: hypothetical protein DI582_05065 [Azospirillum brasilense]